MDEEMSRNDGLVEGAPVPPLNPDGTRPYGLAAVLANEREANRPRYIKGRQIPVASDISRQLDDLKMKVVALEAQARKAGLDDDASALSSLREHVYDVSHNLERKAREAYAAARRGEELPR
jgi:hypothetical protein